MRKNRIEEGKKDPMAGENKQERIGEKSQKPKNKEKPRKQRKKPEEAITRKTEKKKKKKNKNTKKGGGYSIFCFLLPPPFNLQKPPYRLSSGVGRESFVSSSPPVQQGLLLCAIL
jgi:hypothetical protein